MSDYLSNKTKNLDNNFHLIRLIAASLVLFGHSYDLAGLEPNIFSKYIGIGIAAFGVNIFFVVSGFLITRSFINLRNPLKFVFNRILRIYPALIVCCILTVFCLGPLFTKLPLTNYFSDLQIYKFLYSKSSIIGVLITGGGSNLPGVFQGNPFPGTVNGSLWTLIYEVFMYVVVFIFGTLSITILKQIKHSLLINYFIILLLCIALQYYVPAKNEFLNEILNSISRFGICFFCGGLLFIGRHYIVISKPILIIALLCILLKKNSFFSNYLNFIHYFGVAYFVIYFAYYKNVLNSLFNQTNDYSYGIYIYAFPFQQAVISLRPNSNPIEVMLLAGVPTLIMAILSWHLVEKKILKNKTRVFYEPNQSSINNSV